MASILQPGVLRREAAWLPGRDVPGMSLDAGRMAITVTGLSPSNIQCLDSVENAEGNAAVQQTRGSPS